MDRRIRDNVRRRAGDMCEYCRLPQGATPLISFHVDHTIAQQHGGGSGLEDLALACDRCNAYKGPNLASIDEESGELASLFNPRTDAWSDHFRFRGSDIIGLTPVGRATARLLNMNALRRRQLRDEWFRDHGGL